MFYLFLYSLIGLWLVASIALWIKRHFFVIHATLSKTGAKQLFGPRQQWLWRPHGNYTYDTAGREVQYAPYEGSWGILWWQRSPMLIQLLSNSHSGVYCRMMYSTAIPSGRADFINFTRTILDVVETNSGETHIYTLHENHNTWVRQMPCPRRHMGTICLDDKIKQELVDTVTRFLGAESWYREREIPYRLGLLLCGPQGNGKTSIIEALSNHFHRDVYELNLVKCANRNLSECLRKVPPQQIIVVEDLNMIIRSLMAQNHDWEAAHGTVIHQLLHVMDGLQAHTGSIIIVTASNYKDIPSEFKRSGRFDKVWHINNPQAPEVSVYFQSFFPTASNEQCMQFANSVVKHKVPMCEIQNYLTIYRQSATEAIEHVDEHFRRLSET